MGLPPMVRLKQGAVCGFLSHHCCAEAGSRQEATLDGTSGRHWQCGRQEALGVAQPLRCESAAQGYIFKHNFCSDICIFRAHGWEIVCETNDAVSPLLSHFE